IESGRHVPQPARRPRRPTRRHQALSGAQLRRRQLVDHRRREAHQPHDALQELEGLPRRHEPAPVLTGRARETTRMKDLYQLGETPPLGQGPARMLAQVIGQERFGEPKQAFKTEEIATPSELRPDEVLVWVMAAGINYNNVWAGLGSPVDVIKARARDKEWPDESPFHIGGSDASGIVWKTGSAVTSVKPGDHVVIHCGIWKADDPSVKAGNDPMFGPSFRIWGYEANWGSFAQFTRVQ